MATSRAAVNAASVLLNNTSFQASGPTMAVCINKAGAGSFAATWIKSVCAAAGVSLPQVGRDGRMGSVCRAESPYWRV